MLTRSPREAILNIRLSQQTHRGKTGCPWPSSRRPESRQSHGAGALGAACRAPHGWVHEGHLLPEGSRSPSKMPSGPHHAWLPLCPLLTQPWAAPLLSRGPHRFQGIHQFGKQDFLMLPKHIMRYSKGIMKMNLWSLGGVFVGGFGPASPPLSVRLAFWAQNNSPLLF